MSSSIVTLYWQWVNQPLHLTGHWKEISLSFSPDFGLTKPWFDLPERNALTARPQIIDSVTKYTGNRLIASYNVKILDKLLIHLLIVFNMYSTVPTCTWPTCFFSLSEQLTGGGSMSKPSEYTPLAWAICWAFVSFRTSSVSAAQQAEDRKIAKYKCFSHSAGSKQIHIECLSLNQSDFKCFSTERGLEYVSCTRQQHKIIEIEITTTDSICNLTGY